jgi:hypothetical protein
MRQWRPGALPAQPDAPGGDVADALKRPIIYENIDP